MYVVKVGKREFYNKFFEPGAYRISKTQVALMGITYEMVGEWSHEVENEFILSCVDGIRKNLNLQEEL